MKARTRGIVIGLGVLVGLALALLLVRSQGSPARPGTVAATAGTPAPGSTPGASSPGAPAQGPAGKQLPAAAAPGAGATLAKLGWGAGPDQLGRERPKQGNPEGPMSLTADLFGNVVVLDQVNERLVRLDENGKVLGSARITQQTPQDITAARDGTVLVLDRLKDKTVALLNPVDGSLLGELPVEGKGIPQGGGVTGTFVDGDSVYLEREHGALVRVGDTSGKVDPDRPEVPGRPTRDGKLFITAGIVDMRSGRLYLNAIDRQTNQHRYTREYRLDFPLMAITLLDTDRSGTIYLGVAGELPTGRVDPATQPAVRLFCIAPADGAVTGQTDLPLNTMPEESFRDFTVLDGGGVVYQLRTEQGVSLVRANCRG